ncbi:hypothetical protein [Halorussus ruber]|uniref:hypothetical protein n=1 Tax=Halorussus ruber TaxID=1126238 RepID=UPI0010932A68|nr:hypothetical protein [Halorussus ruber]
MDESAAGPRKFDRFGTDFPPSVPETRDDADRSSAAAASFDAPPARTLARLTRDRRSAGLSTGDALD